jgi:ATP-dependent protease ClpP protease subunit
LKPEVLKFDFKQQLEKPDTLDLYIYSEVAPDGYEWWSGETVESETSANFFREKLSEYSNVKYINLYINSVGGSVIEGYGIYAQLKRHPAEKTVYVDGFANSIASIIAMAGDKVIMYQNSVMGIHNMMDYCFGNSAEHRKCADNIDSMMEGNRQIYLTRSGGKITLEKLTELLDAETMLTAEECLGYGFCDEIADAAADPQKMTQAMQRMNAGTAQQIKYYQSLRQTLGEAMSAFNTQNPANKPKDPPPADPPANPPQENKTIKFFNALMGGKE